MIPIGTMTMPGSSGAPPASSGPSAAADVTYDATSTPGLGANVQVAIENLFTLLVSSMAVIEQETKPLPAQVPANSTVIWRKVSTQQTFLLHGAFGDVGCVELTDAIP